MPYPKWIDDIKQSFHAVCKTVDPKSHLPFDGFMFYPLYGNLFLDKMYETIKKCEKNKIPFQKILENLPATSSIRFNFVNHVFMISWFKYDRSKAKTIIDFFVKALKQRTYTDAMALQYNVEFSPDKINEKIKLKNLDQGDKNIASIIGKLVVSSACLVHGLYNDYCTDYGYEITGPYDVSKTFGPKSTLLIREFPDLKPLALWPEFANFPVESVKIYAVYNNVNIKILLIGCHMIFKENLLEHLTNYQIIINNKVEKDLSKINQIIAAIADRGGKFYDQYLKLGLEKHKEIYLFQQCYQFKKIFDLVNLSWQPSIEMLNLVKNKKLVKYAPEKTLTQDEFDEVFGFNYLKSMYKN